MAYPQQYSIAVRDLNRMGYADCLRIQRRVHEQVLEGSLPSTLLLVEHDPVITISRRKGVERHLLADHLKLEQLGIDVQPTDRGGDITYHGPGQLVAYPIVRLSSLGLNIGRYMRLLEHAVINCVRIFGIESFRQPKLTGAWAEDSSGAPRKLCAMGVRVRCNVTMHGLALNVCPNLDHFDTIIPCGLVGSGVTSMKQLLAGCCPTVARVKRQLTSCLTRCLEDAATTFRNPRIASPIEPTPLGHVSGL